MVRASLLAVRMLFAGSRGGPEINYDKLRGLPRSFAREAGANALAGRVPRRSADAGARSSAASEAATNSSKKKKVFEENDDDSKNSKNMSMLERLRAKRLKRFEN